MANCCMCTTSSVNTRKNRRITDVILLSQTGAERGSILYNTNEIAHVYPQPKYRRKFINEFSRIIQPRSIDTFFVKGTRFNDTATWNPDIMPHHKKRFENSTTLTNPSMTGLDNSIICPTKQDTSFEVSFSFMSIPLTERTARPIFIPTSPYEQHRKQDCLEQQSMQTRLGIRVSSASQENNKCQQSGFFLNFGNTTTDHEI